MSTPFYLPGLPIFYDMKWVNDDYKLSADASLYMDTTFQTLDSAIELLNAIALSAPQSDGSVDYNGLQFPHKTEDEITAYSTNDSVPNGTAWWDTDNSLLKYKESDGTIKTIATV